MEEYWTVSTGVAVRNGWSCRDCKGAIMKGESCYVRDGRKLRLFYHERCFSGTADPRTQTHSSFQKWRNAIADHAPAWKGRGKWSVSSYGYEGSKLVPIGTIRNAGVVGANKREKGIIRQESGAMSGTKAEAHDTRETVKGETEPVHEVTLASSVRLQGPSTSICPEKGLGDVSSS